MSRKGIQGITVLGWGEWGDRSEVVVYKDLEGFEELDGSVVRPNVGEIILEVVNQLGGWVVRTVIPDAEYHGVCSMRVGLDKGVWCEESIRGINYKVKREDDLFSISGSPLEVMF